MKKVLSLLLSLLVILPMLESFVSAQAENIVILVSDNEADSALAEKVAEILNAKVVVTPWGIYNESVVAEIMSLNPSLVIIIGGPKAVSPQYYDALQSLGISYTPIWGKDRVETSEKVIEFLMKDYPQLFSNVTLVIVYGWDLSGIARLRHLKDKHVIPLFVSKNTNVSINASNILIIETPFSEKFMFRYKEMFHHAPIIKANITPEVANESIKNAEIALERAERIIERNVTSPLVSRLLDKAEDLLNKAKEKFSAGNYVEAYVLALHSKWLAERALSISLTSAYHITISAERKLTMELRLLWTVTLRLEKAGYNVDTIKELLQKAQEALKNRDYVTASRYLEEAKDLLRKIREENHPSPPVHGKVPGRGRRGP
ncbi:cell wall-binding repeat-containing protein [Pyrococcus sp. ST04]|uniref:cell wall-binding repeat-containing protein n=1 Tax=Pyrococcus sp. ST04 TaxID=1183377 RepID=UPI0002605DCC|nr:cell wall-binding repeat-containing protein [Pyrococcus sp. ST04]AFK23131.1 hypothetical protein Py04_1560 [Pyrococcus sp. ST04]